jgi:hypothetical protein
MKGVLMKDFKEYKSEHGEDVYDQKDRYFSVDFQDIEARYSNASDRDLHSSPIVEKIIYALGDTEEDIGKRTKPPYDYVNPQRLSDLAILGFSDVQIAQTLSVSPESVKRARSLYL